MWEMRCPRQSTLIGRKAASHSPTTWRISADLTGSVPPLTTAHGYCLLASQARLRRGRRLGAEAIISSEAVPVPSEVIVASAINTLMPDDVQS